MKFNSVEFIADSSLNNAAYTEQYKEEYHEYMLNFTDKQIDNEKTETESISDNYRIQRSMYCESKVLQKERQYTLIDKNENVVFEWICFDSDCDFHTIIKHQNGNEYLIYREELYGYSVLDLKTKKTFQYYPQCVVDGSEYFIWTQVYYNPISNLLAVDGCIWACPWSLLIVDFSDPMSEPLFQIDICDFIVDECNLYEDAIFKKWDNELLICDIYNTAKREKETFSFNPKQYIKLS